MSNVQQFLAWVDGLPAAVVEASVLFLMLLGWLLITYLEDRRNGKD